MKCVCGCTAPTVFGEEFPFLCWYSCYFAAPVFPEAKLVPNYLWHVAEALSRQPSCQKSNPGMENAEEAAPTEVFALVTPLMVGVW